MNKKLIYCDMCKVDHCGHKVVMLFPEDKAVWLLEENGVPVRLCELHKKILEDMGKKHGLVGNFVSLKRVKK